MNWILVADALPPNEMPVLACVRIFERLLVLRASYVRKFEVEADFEVDASDGDYNEANDTYYWPEGWYETNQQEEIHWMIHDVLAWMPLPEPPEGVLG